jgi:hypothetical protein
MTRPQFATARRLAVTLTVAGAAALGSVAIAPAASAAPAESMNYLIEGSGNGPDVFVVTATGRIPVFFCDDVKPGKEGVVDAKDIARAAKKASDEAAKAAREAQKTAQGTVDRVMKQHNICLVTAPGADRF